MCIIGAHPTAPAAKISSGSFFTPGTLAVRFFEDGAVVFHRESGATHRLGLTASAVLDALLAGLTGEQEIGRHAATLLGSEDDAELHLRVEECLRTIRDILES